MGEEVGQHCSNQSFMGARTMVRSRIRTRSRTGSRTRIGNPSLIDSVVVIIRLSLLSHW